MVDLMALDGKVMKVGEWNSGGWGRGERVGVGWWAVDLVVGRERKL